MFLCYSKSSLRNLWAAISFSFFFALLYGHGFIYNIVLFHLFLTPFILHINVNCHMLEKC